MTFSPSTVVRTETSVDFSSGLTISGDVVYFTSQEALVIIDEETGLPERLSVNLGHYGLFPRPGHVFIKDWSEGSGVAASLVENGLVEMVETHKVGPFESPAHEVRVLV